VGGVAIELELGARGVVEGKMDKAANDDGAISNPPSTVDMFATHGIRPDASFSQHACSKTALVMINNS
jgi:hypothetical protein